MTAQTLFRAIGEVDEAMLQDAVVAAALLGAFKGGLIQRKVARNAPQKWRQKAWPRRGHGVPRAQPGVVHTFLRVLAHGHQPPGNGKAICAVFFLCVPNGLRRALPIQLHNGRILHRAFPLSACACKGMRARAGPRAPRILLSFYL